MCLMKVKEEPDYSVPARVRTYKRSSRRYSSPPRYYDREPTRSQYDRGYARYSSSRVVEERKPSASVLPPPVEPPAPLPPPAPSSHSSPPPPPSAHHTTHRSASRHTSRAPSAHTATRTHYVEVEHDDALSDTSSASSHNDVRSRATHKTARTHKTHRTSASSHRPPPSDYMSVHEREKETRRERAYSKPRGPEYETFRYVNAPPDDGYGPRRSQGGYYR